jgi:hypothetical protein
MTGIAAMICNAREVIEEENVCNGGACIAGYDLFFKSFQIVALTNTSQQSFC